MCVILTALLCVVLFSLPTVTEAVMKTGSQRPGRFPYLLRWWRRCRKSRRQPEKRNSSPLCQVRGHYTWTHCDRTLFSALVCAQAVTSSGSLSVVTVFSHLLRPAGRLCDLPERDTFLWWHFCVCVCTCVWNIRCTLISSEPKPVYAQPGQPDVDLPVSPADAPVPSVSHDDSILRCASLTFPKLSVFSRYWEWNVLDVLMFVCPPSGRAWSWWSLRRVRAWGWDSLAGMT